MILHSSTTNRSKCTGGTITLPPGGSAQPGRDTSRTGGVVDSYTLTHFDDENRPIAEMQSVPGFVTAAYDTALQSFKVTAVNSSTGSPYASMASSYTVGSPVPTKLYHYDSDDRLSGVSLPILEVNPQSPASSLRPRYEYGYDYQGNQTLIRDPLGRETRFTFTDRGQQATRTMPLGFGSDGIASAAGEAIKWVRSLLRQIKGV
jgi:YD repeat-containing protein